MGEQGNGEDNIKGVVFVGQRLVRFNKRKSLFEFGETAQQQGASHSQHQRTLVTSVNLHTVKLMQAILDFSGLDPVSAQLDLAVESAQMLEVSAG